MRRRRPLVVAAATLVLANAALAASEPAPAVGEEPPPSSPPALTDSRLSSELQGVAVDSAAYRRSLARYQEAERRLVDARRRAESAQHQLGVLGRAEVRLVASLDEAARRKGDSEQRLAAIRAAMGELAVAAYVDGGLGAPASLDPATLLEARQRRTLIDVVTSDKVRESRAHRAIIRRMSAILDHDTAVLELVRQQIAETASARDVALDDASRAERDLLARAGPLLDDRMEARVIGLDFPLVVLDAYVKAASRLSTERPRCALRWQALAGIGKVESAHGTYGGARVSAGGQLSRTILGPPLDGTNGNLLITDTDGGELDGDPVLDRAVGPMQFIPTSWRALGRDGDGDGHADPHNVYDAALAAATLLCRGDPLDSDSGLRRAFLRYNNSTRYAEQVLERMRGYEAFALPPPPG